MGVYCYTAVPKKGQSRRGVIDADSFPAAKEKLRQQGVLVTRLWVKAERHSREALRGENRMTFTSQLAQLITSGMPVFESLVALEEQNRGESHHRVIQNLCDQIQGGASLSAAMAKHPSSFNSLYCAMVAAGEASGSLGTALKRLAELLVRQLRMRKQLVSALTYPAIVATFCILVVYLLLTFAIPSMAALFGEGQMNAFTASVLAVSAFLSAYWPLYLPLLASLVIGTVMFFRTDRGLRLWKTLLIRIPIVGSVATRAALARFCRSLATLQEGGLTLIDSLRLARAVMLNPVLESGMLEAEARMVEGSSLSVQLGRQPFVPRLMSRMVAVGEESGNLSSMLLQVADLYEGDVERTLNRLTSLIQPAVLLIMGTIVGLIMLAVLLPLTDVSAIF